MPSLHSLHSLMATYLGISSLFFSGNGTITSEQMYYLNLYWEFGDLVDVYGGYLPPYYEAFEHCSALVRVLDNNTDIFIGQVLKGKSCAAG